MSSAPSAADGAEVPARPLPVADLQLGRRHRPPEQEALHVVAADRADRLELLGRLDALGHPPELEHRVVASHEVDDHPTAVASAHAPHEGPVDLPLPARYAPPAGPRVVPPSVLAPLTRTN